MKLAMKAPMPAAPVADARRQPAPAKAYAGETGQRQQQVWEGVRKTQAQARRPLGAPVRSAQSASSLQLALENEQLIDAQQAYIKALKAAGENGDDIVGFVFAINGKINSADVYPSNGLFRKMWDEAPDGERDRGDRPQGRAERRAASVDAVMAFIAAADAGKASEKALNAGVKLATRDSDKAYASRPPAPRGVTGVAGLGASELSGEVIGDPRCRDLGALPSPHLEREPTA